MANLTETETYEAGIYQLETSDKLLGGVDGISNRQAAQLANRTAWLKANGLAASSGTFEATLNMHSDPANITDTNVTAQETGSYVRVGDMVWISVGGTITQYNNHVLKHITGLPYPAAKKGVLAVGDARGVMYRWSTGSGIQAGRLYALVDVGSVRLDLCATHNNTGRWQSWWGTENIPDLTKKYQIAGWYQASAGA